MDFQPPQTLLANPLALPEEKQPSDKVIPDVVEMRRNGVNSAPEVKVVRKVEVVYFRECSSNVEL